MISACDEEHVSQQRPVLSSLKMSTSAAPPFAENRIRPSGVGAQRVRQCAGPPSRERVGIPPVHQRRIKWSNDYGAGSSRRRRAGSWTASLGAETSQRAISINGDEAMELAVRNVGERYGYCRTAAPRTSPGPLCVAGTPDDCAREVGCCRSRREWSTSTWIPAPDADGPYRQMDLSPKR